MNKLFAKYIPVPGEIKAGDMALKPSFKWEGHFGQSLVEPPYIEEVDEDEDISTMKLVKLFLCSKDIHSGDRFYTKVGSEEETWVDTYREPTDEWFKVLGEVSPKAIWVKPDMEFEEDDIQREDFYEEYDYAGGHFTGNRIGIKYYPQLVRLEPEQAKNYILTIKFKCPCCGDFK